MAVSSKFELTAIFFLILLNSQSSGYPISNGKHQLGTILLTQVFGSGFRVLFQAVRGEQDNPRNRLFTLNIHNIRIIYRILLYDLHFSWILIGQRAGCILGITAHGLYFPYRTWLVK
jgi:hypothetical protein